MARHPLETPADMCGISIQGVVRDFYQISKPTLAKELEELRTHIGTAVTQETWDSIDTIRSVGNIGAHMEKDINIVIDVDADEAELLIELVETLIEDTYIARDARVRRLAKAQALKAEKAAAKTSKAPKTTP